jgi:DNA-binding NarL/FixJ family response regulator
MKLLITDDSDAIVNRLVAALSEVDGLEVVGRAGTVLEAQRAVRLLRPDVMILDLHMPGGSGVEVLDGIRREGLSTIVIVLTNYNDAPYRKKCLEKGAQFFLDKSADFDQVAGVMKTLIERKEAE